MTNTKLAEKLRQYIQDRPKLFKSLVKIVNLGSRLIGSLFILLQRPKYSSQKLELSDDKIEVLLLDKQHTYLSLLSQVQDSHGFIESRESDSLLFSGLLGASGAQVDILAARDEKGQWFRRPLDVPLVNTASTISRDMLVGLLWYLWANKRVDLAEELYQYGMEHDWIMGDGDVSRIYMTPGLQATLADMIKAMGGKDHCVTRLQLQTWPSGLTGYERHLDLLHILLRGQIKKGITAGMLKSLKAYKAAEPHNALACYAADLYADGNQDQASEILLKTELFPEKRLPSAKDRYEPWLWQRDYMKGDSVNNDWLPDPSSDKVHSGGDYLFVVKLMLGK